jgi:uncharacterized protein
LESDQIPSFVSLEKEKLSLPFEFFKYENIVIFIARIQPTQSEMNEVTKKIAEWVVENKFTESIMVGGLDSGLKEDDDGELKVVPTNKFLNHDKIGEILPDKLFVTGPLALMLIYFEMLEFPACAILPYCERDRPDPRAAATAIKTLVKLYPNLKINLDKLYSDAKKIEEEINLILKQERDILEPKENKGMYV